MTYSQQNSGAGFHFFIFILCLSGLQLIGGGVLKAEEGRRFRVGVIAPLSGPVASMGEAFRRGFELYEKDQPGGHVQFIFEDHKYDGKESVTALHKLKNVNGIDLAIVWGNTPSGSCAPVAEQGKIPVIAVSMNPDGKNRDYVVTLGPPIEKLIDKVLQQFREWKLKNAAAISIDIGNALIGINMLKERLNGQLLVKTIANDESDFKTLIATLKARSVDGLVLFAYPEQALTFLRQARQMQYFPNLVGGDVFADILFQQKASDLTEKLKFVYGSVDPEFISRLVKVYGSASYFFETASGYALAVLAERLAERSKGDLSTANPLAVIEKLETSGVPLGGMRFLKTEDYGRHFEVDGAMYNVPLALSDK